MAKIERNLVCVAIVLGTVTGHAAPHLRIVPPEGFVDVFSPAPLPGCVQPEVVAWARSQHYLACAVDARCPDEVRARFAASQQQLDGPVDESYLDRTIAHTRSSFSRSALTSFTVRERRLVSIAGVHGARLVMDMTQNGESTRILMYLVPDGRDVVLLTYQTSAANFDQYLERFERAAAATSGGREPPATLWFNGALKLGVASFVVYHLKKYFERRNNRKRGGPDAVA